MGQREVVAKGSNWVWYSDNSFRIDKVLASYPHCGKPYAGKDNDSQPAFSVTALLDKKTHGEIKQRILVALDAMLKEHKQPTGAGFPAEKKCLRDGDKSGKETHFGAWTLSLREPRMPAVRKANKLPMTPEEAEKLIYGGCRVNVLGRLWFQDNKYGKRVNCNFLAIQLVDGTLPAFGEGRISDQEIDESLEAEESFEGDGDEFDGL